MVVDFNPDGNAEFEGNYVAYVDSNDDLDSTGEKIIASNNLPGNITVTGVAFGPGGAVICFNTQGLPSRGGTSYNGSVTLQNVRGVTRQVTLNAAGGVTIQ